MKVYILTLEYQVESGREFEVLRKGYSNLEDAKKHLNRLYEDEVQLGWFKEDAEDVTITKTDTLWFVDLNCYEKYCQCEIIEVEVTN